MLDAGAELVVAAALPFDSTPLVVIVYLCITYVLLAAAEEMTGSIGANVDVAPPSKVKRSVEMEMVFCVDEEVAARPFAVAAFVAPGSCLQKLVKEGESFKPV